MASPWRLPLITITQHQPGGPRIDQSTGIKIHLNCTSENFLSSRSIAQIFNSRHLPSRSNLKRSRRNDKSYLLRRRPCTKNPSGHSTRHTAVTYKPYNCPRESSTCQPRAPPHTLRIICPSPWSSVGFFIHSSQVTICNSKYTFFFSFLYIVKSYDFSFSAMC